MRSHRFIAGAVLLGTVFSSGCTGGGPTVGLRVDTSAPDFSLTDLDGKQVSLGAFRDRVVLLTFFGVG